MEVEWYPVTVLRAEWDASKPTTSEGRQCSKCLVHALRQGTERHHVRGGVAAPASLRLGELVHVRVCVSAWCIFSRLGGLVRSGAQAFAISLVLVHDPACAHPRRTVLHALVDFGKEQMCNILM